MALQDINIGFAPNDGLGDTARAAGEKINANFHELDQVKQPLAQLLSDLAAAPDLTAARAVLQIWAANVPFAPASGIVATNVQAAIVEAIADLTAALNVLHVIITGEIEDEVDILEASINQLDVDLSADIAAVNVAKQDKDPTLTAIAAVANAADQLVFFTDVDVVATTAFTAFARTLLAGATATAMRSTLGLVLATQAIAEAATNNTDVMTPLRGKQLIDANRGKGAVAQVQIYTLGVVSTGTAVIPIDDTIPQIGEGTVFLNAAFTPLYANSKLLIEVIIHIANSATSGNVVAFFETGTSNALLSAYSSSLANNVYNVSMQKVIPSTGVIARNFQLRAGPGSAGGTTTINGSGGGQLLGGSLETSIKITEIMA